MRRHDQEHCASITSMIRHYVARRAQVIEDHPHNAAMRHICTTARLLVRLGYEQTRTSLFPTKQGVRTLTGAHLASTSG